ncbi:TolB family protein [Streptomyces sp. H27-D2]|uniref:TolB family protein n=1 Tax=Streptomyces sp. H27-D2 TaxID=3046304 RepID=UPI002DBB796F|nr:hypothetical protein [Streptomyces sp. H27-D2]MEC4017249.1 hypothetical protein [Streptomyces sp. H27-D2]
MLRRLRGEPLGAGAGKGNESRIYVRDRKAGSTELVSHAPDDYGRGCVSPSISADGRMVAYQDSYSNGPRGDDWGDIFVHDRLTKRERHVDATHDGAEADKASTTPLISADGKTVAFNSYATNLVPGADPNTGWNPFVRNLRTGALQRVDGVQPTDIAAADAISADGSKLLFSSAGAGQEGLYLRDLRSGEDKLVTPGTDGEPNGGEGVIDRDGSVAAFSGYDGDFVPGDGNDTSDVFVRYVR